MAGDQKAQMVVERKGHEVVVTVECADEYAAIEIYDRICAGAKEGHIDFDFEVKGHRHG